ncbi:MAG TPA: DUF1566 domain-containing protein, partial [Saprospiraceae bacterium]|nr:DUF1566 domain-containing protein [Saprospiraceae bacterium]
NVGVGTTNPLNKFSVVGSADFTGSVGIGTIISPAKMTVLGSGASPTIPGLTSSGVMRIGVSSNEGIDIGKMGTSPYSGWIQAGFNGVVEPFSLQPLGGSVGIGTVSPNNSSVLDISSTTKGFLPPRMTMSNRNSITTPVEGLVIWCNNCSVYGQLQVFNGLIWTDMFGFAAADLPAVGDSDGGGRVAYILQTGDPGYVAGEIHGLIAAYDDLSLHYEWGCYPSEIPGADAIAIGAGNQNTIDIMNGCGTPDIAARMCGNLTLGGYSDWYLPSKNELNRLYVNRVAIGGFADNFYWSSSEISIGNALYQNFANGEQPNISKSVPLWVRPVRSF